MEKDSSKASPPRATAKASSPRREAAASRPRSGPAELRPTSPQALARAQTVGRDVQPGEPKRSRQSAKPSVKPNEASSEPGAVRRTRLRQPNESRAQMLERLSNPLISLHEASVLLQVCAATVRRLSNEGDLPHKRTEGGQRRFHLRDVLRLSDERERRRAASGRVSARSQARPSSLPTASSAPASARQREQERLEEVRAEQARVHESRERLAAVHARAQQARLNAPQQPSSTSGAAPSETQRVPNPLRLGLTRALVSRANASASKPKAHEGDE